MLEKVLNIYETNEEYFKISMNGKPSIESAIEDKNDIPPGSNFQDKYYKIISINGQDIGIIDYIMNYLDEDAIYIGLFMINGDFHRQGYGKAFIEEFTANMREKGLGTKLMDETINILKNEGCKQASLWVYETNIVCERGTAMTRSEQAIFTNMCMIYNEDYILVQDRQNLDWPGVTFPGGHVEYGESFVESVKREVFEETGLIIENPILCGVKQFQTKQNQRYVVLFFKTNQFEGNLKSSKEGDVFWIEKENLCEYKLAPDFLDMFNIFESDNLSEFYYYKEHGKWQKKLL